MRVQLPSGAADGGLSERALPLGSAARPQEGVRLASAQIPCAVVY